MLSLEENIFFAVFRSIFFKTFIKTIRFRNLKTYPPPANSTNFKNPFSFIINMKKSLVIFFLSLIFFIPFILSASVDSEIQKLTYYAEEYETGNINYVQLRVYLSSVKENLNEILGARGKENDGILKQEQIENVLGEPTDETKWVWVEGEERETKLDYYVPTWEKIIFDGKKIQIKLEAFPSIFNKRDFDEEDSAEDFEKNLTEEIEDGDLIYRLHFNIRFKKPEEQLNIKGKISEIQSLAQDFNSEPSQSNAETLAEKSVNAEKTFENSFRENPLQCSDLMISIFGSENKREDQQILLNEINFFEGENFEAKIRLEMCDECNYNWINLNMWLEGRGNFKNPEVEYQEISKEIFQGKSDEEFESEALNLISEIQKFLEHGDYASAVRTSHKFNALNNAWNEKSNDVWEEINKEFQLKVDSMGEEERSHFDQDFGWIKQEQEKRQKVKELQKQNYEKRKQFYLNLFSEYDKKEYSFTQSEFEKRLIEEFKTGGEEICNNNLDDNLNEQIDCAESQCSGKICGKGMKQIQKENETNNTEEIEVDFYCIQNTCQAKEELIIERGPVCGNHICEESEADVSKECSLETPEICSPIQIKGTCREDCAFAACPEYPAIECDGKVIFSGEDENGCPLKPTCVEEVNFCNSNEECKQPLCGISECVKDNSENAQGTCQVAKLTECKLAECADGEKEIKKCESGKEIISQICINGLWKKTEEKTEECIILSEPEPPSNQIMPLPKECLVRSDCGGKNDVCSNGECITLPEIISEPEKILEPEENNFAEENLEQTPQFNADEQNSILEKTQESGKFIFGIFQGLISNIKITGKQIDEGGEVIPTQEAIPTSNEEDNNAPESENKENELAPKESNNEIQREENFERQEDDREEWKEREDEEKEMREAENRARCEKDCVRPCIEKCIRESCGEEFSCNIDEEKVKCESDCSPESSCVEKCATGEENWWKEFENKDEHKEEKGVFAVGGGCRNEQQKTEGHIWFNGWGEPFEKIEPLKQKYYQGFNSEWCKDDLENLKKQRQEFEKGFNQEFAKWFFEDYLANSAEEWEQATSGIYEIYWTDVDNIMQTAQRMDCLNLQEFSDYNLINVKYESEYGSIEFWEELKTAKMPEMDKEINVITPYMKIWVFPSKEFMKYEMKKAMENGEFPGEDKTERKNEEGPTEKEREMIKQNKKFIEEIKKVSDKYGGNLNALIQIKDYETNEIVFNIYAQVNEEDIIKMKPMLPEQVSEEDARIEIDFEKIYSLVSVQEKEVRGEEIQSPPWDKKQRKGFKDMQNGAKMYFKIIGIINSAQIYPEEAKKDVKSLFNLFIKMAMQGDKEGGDNSEFNKEFEENEKELEEINFQE